MSIDEAKSEFLRFCKEYESYKSVDLSESDTRSKIIDFILINVLGWSETDIVREGHVDSGFFDYKVSIAGFNMVVEAKRQFKDFVIPGGLRHAKLSTLYKENKEVIDQIRGYLGDLGQDIGVITNGRQFLVAKFVNTNGIPWKDNICFIYNGLNDIEDSFVDFWNNLSKEGVIEFCGIKCLQTPVRGFAKTILSTITQNDNEISRNDLTAAIAPLISKVFGEIFHNDEDNDDLSFIKECYVENKEVIKNKAELNGLFSDEAPSLKEVIRARNHNSITRQVKSEINQEDDIKSVSPTPKPIIIIGSKGAGKTTFINFLFRHNMETDIISKFPYVIVNLMNYYSGDKYLDLNQIAEDILSQFDIKYPERGINKIEVLKRVYIHEINQNDKGIWKYIKENNEALYNEKLSSFLSEKLSNSRRHLTSLNQYFVKEIHRRAIIVFDNADQLSEEIQEQVFLFACSLNTEGKFGTIISLREGYYYKFRNKPPFNAFESNVYHIAAPDYGLVLQKRIDYAIESISKDSLGAVSGTIDNKHYSLQGKNIVDFFTGIRNSLFGDSNSPILDFIRFTTFPDIREGLRVFKTFLVSGYTNVSEYVLRVVFNKDDHNITIPMHEFVQAVGLENKLYYNHETSIVQNLFYPASPESDYFVRIYLLRKLKSIRDIKGNVDAFTLYDSILDVFSEYGYTRKQLSQELAYLLEKGFIDADKKLTDVKWNSFDGSDFSITITSKGYYYLNDIINKFYYIDLVLQDTPIFSQDAFNSIRSNFALRNSDYKRDMSKRISTVKLFMEYLRQEEQKQVPLSLIKAYGSIIDQIYSLGLEDDLKRLEKRSSL